MKSIVERSIRDVSRAGLPLKIIGCEIDLEKEYDERIGKGNEKAFMNFRILLCVFRDICSLFVRDEELEAALPCVLGGSKVVEVRETVRQKLLKIMQLLEDNSELNESSMKLRIVEISKTICELRGESFPRLLELLTAVKKTLEDEE